MKSRVAFLLGFCFAFFGFAFWQKNLIKPLFFALKGERKIISPLSFSSRLEPQVLGEITTLENDFSLGEINQTEGVLAQGVLVYDLKANKIILERDIHRQLQAASTVKIVTAAVALEKGQLEEEMTVNFFPTIVGESSMNLLVGEKFTLEDLLYGLILVSGNDAAETIAQGLAGRRDLFVSWMNDFSRKVGAKNTVFTTPSGLDEPGQYTTAWDLFLLAKNIWQTKPKVFAISGIKEKYLPKTAGHRAYLLRNKLLLADEFFIKGGKPGLGEQGMLSLVAVLEKNGRQILVILLRTPSLRHDLTQIVKTF